MSRLYEIYLSINDFEILAEFNVLQNLHLCAQKSVSATNLGPFGEIGANFSLQLSSRTRFDKINKKKVIAENQCEKHKKSSLDSHACMLEGSLYAFCISLHYLMTGRCLIYVFHEHFHLEGACVKEWAFIRIYKVSVASGFE